IVCLIKIKSKLSIFDLKKLIASIFLKTIFLSLSLWFSISIPIGLDFNLNFMNKLPKIFPLPQPISKIFEFELRFECFIKNLLKELIYSLDDSQVLLSQFLIDFITYFNHFKFLLNKVLITNES